MNAIVSRRALLQVSAGAGGALLLGFPLGAAGADRFAPNAFIRLAPDGMVTLVMPQQEMGQGIHTAHSQILAEEFDIAWDRIALEQAPPDDLLYGGPRKRQGTGGSSSIRSGFVPVLRQAGADARALVVAAAAKGWGVDPASCRTQAGVVVHDATGRRATYGSLAATAATLPPPATPAPLKSPADFRLIGTSAKRLDSPAKLTGAATYGIDVRIPGAGVATLAMAPVIGGKVKTADAAAARAVPGVRQVVLLDDLVAVVGDHMWAAMKGVEALAVTWDDGDNAALDSAAIWTKLRADSNGAGVAAHSKGDAGKALASGGRIEADYELPFLAHAPMEPLNATVHVEPDRCTIWMGTQVQTRARAAAAAVLGLPPEKIILNNHMLGGAFGRRLDIDMVTNAVRIAQRVAEAGGGPVKIVWTREEDMRHDMYRPAYRNVMAATLEGGRVNGWSHRVAAGSVQARMSGQPPKDGLDRGNVEGATELLYDIPHQEVRYVRSEPVAVNVGYWRGVGPNNSIYAVECFIDELAARAGADPVAFRLAMLGNEPRAAAVLRLAADKAGWGQAPGARRGRGVAVQKAFGSYMAAVAEVSVAPDGSVKVDRITSAVDAGLVINPDTLVAQVEGGLLYGLTAVLHGDITVARGRVVESNFHEYLPLRIDAVPAIDVHIVAGPHDPGGIGEPGTTAVTPAVVNAIAAATGVRLRRLPVDPRLLKA
ncbi:xanthine dehydrogenase family protein molybdopterin-binding subunit [Polymorphobacter fuscus]|uniref:Molybdopterin-dependent oxidoreductase n=1 Tax=Sandarakinorhabdus fusca TaxID=1439888 RepID=A0A7C9KW84_9SPHN|nr:molybdopterin cofactor-binding domain-containing protein [Polymorphobacter fuscus]KAB7648220.1 xanthine dehydrogenase family protein molybdopterin-binding subunit [Polymorphobacter fuscus]MQT15726.1 molybdopterin-dependent oxidoreductase [Polymorphobacter fuscus]NJC08003.1 isoquinoline 1-oxidoreductase beta subunit [Polymorphobacter fuscus]